MILARLLVTAGRLTSTKSPVSLEASCDSEPPSVVWRKTSTPPNAADLNQDTRKGTCGHDGQAAGLLLAIWSGPGVISNRPLEATVNAPLDPDVPSEAPAEFLQLTWM